MGSPWMVCEVVSSSFPELFKQNQMSTCQDPVSPTLRVSLNDSPASKIPGAFPIPGAAGTQPSLLARFPARKLTVTPGIGLGALCKYFRLQSSHQPRNVDLMSLCHRWGSHGSESLCDLPKVTQQGSE